MSSDFLEKFQDIKFNPYMKDLGHGILDELHGCMVSKWVSIEFRKIYAIDKDYLQVIVIYMEPFSDFDHIVMCFEWNKIPQNLMKVYEFSKTGTYFETCDNTVEMYVPYLYNSRKTLLKRYPSNVWVCGDIQEIEGIYLTTRKDLRKIDNIFNLNV